MRRVAWAALLLASTAIGCHRVSYVTGLPAAGDPYTEKASFFLFGLIGTADVDLARVCPDGVAGFQNRMQVDDALLFCMTCSLYTPMTIEVYCASGQAWLAVPDPEQEVTWVYELDDPPPPGERSTR
jgi:hypothetical protein